MIQIFVKPSHEDINIRKIVTSEKEENKDQYGMRPTVCLKLASHCKAKPGEFSSLRPREPNQWQFIGILIAAGDGGETGIEVWW